MAGVGIYAMNKGEVAATGLARVDLEALKFAAEQQINWQPTKLGPMMLRAGTQFLGEINGDAPAQMIEAVYGSNDTALIELTAGAARFWVDDALVSRSRSDVVIQDFGSWSTSVSQTASVTLSSVAFNAGTPAPSTNFVPVAVAYGNGVFVAAGSNGGTVPAVATSADSGLTWTSRTMAPSSSFNINKVAFGGGNFVAVGKNANGSGNPIISTSPDGVNWTQRTPVNPTHNFPLTALCFSNGYFYAGGRDITASTSIIMRSSNGINWAIVSQIVFGGAFTMESCAYGSGINVMVGGRTGLSAQCWRSINGGTSWALGNFGVTNFVPKGIAYGAGLFLVCGYVANIPALYSSPDGKTWTQRFSVHGTGQFYDITFGGGQFLVIGFSGTTPIIESSYTGITWGTLAAVPSSNWRPYGIGHDGVFVAVGDNGASNPVISYTSGASGITISHVLQKNISYAEGTLTIAGALDGTEFSLRIVIDRATTAPLVSIGSTAGAGDILAQTRLGEGVHSLAIPATVSPMHLRIASDALSSIVISSITIEDAAPVMIASPFLADHIGFIKTAQSLDEIWLAHSAVPTQIIERFSKHSFSLLTFQPTGGPFAITQGDPSIQMSVPTGNEPQGTTVIHASAPIFKPDDVGRLMRLFHNKQEVKLYLAANETYTDSIRIAGLKESAAVSGGTAQAGRTLTITITGTWANQVNLQRSYDPDGLIDWTDVVTFVANVTGVTKQDTNDNVIAYYRLGFTDSNYASGNALCVLSTPGGAGHGTGRIVAVNSPVEIVVDTTKAFLRTTNQASNWRMSEWNSAKGYPSAAAIHESRLCFGVNGQIWASSSDEFPVFDFDEVGDAATISRTIGQGANQNINWIVSSGSLFVGTDDGIFSIQSGSLAIGDPLTPSKFIIRRLPTNDGSSFLRGLRVENGVVYVNRTERRILAGFQQPGLFQPSVIDLSVYNPDIILAGFSDCSVQNQLDTHVRIARNDGQMVNLLIDIQEKARAFWRTQIDGMIENIAVLPAKKEDAVYIVANRTINGVTKRYLEKFARQDECQGGTLNKLLDCHIVYSGAPTATITGLGHLEGKMVAVWGDGHEIGFDRANPSLVHTYLVTGGSITIPEAVSNAVIGLPYTATFVSSKLAFADPEQQPVTKHKRVHKVGFVLANTHMQGVRYGHYHGDPSESTLRDLPLMERGQPVASGAIHSQYDQQEIAFPGIWDTDSRIQIIGQGPRPATVMACTIDMSTSS